MAYKCVKCGSDDVVALKPTRFEVETIIYKDSEGKFSGDVGFGTKEEEVKTILFCKYCNNSGYPSDTNKFTPFEVE